MSSIDTWLQPLREYPRWLVFLAFTLSAGAVVWAITKVVKWSIYVLGLLAFVAITAVFALWLFA